MKLNSFFSHHTIINLAYVMGFASNEIQLNLNIVWRKMKPLGLINQSDKTFIVYWLFFICQRR